MRRGQLARGHVVAEKQRMGARAPATACGQQLAAAASELSTNSSNGGGGREAGGIGRRR